MKNKISSFLFVLLCMLAISCESPTEAQYRQTDSMMEPQTSDEGSTMTLRGEFTYMADAAIFKDYVSGRILPVATEGQYPEAERRYTKMQLAGKPAYTVLKGKVVARPSMEESQGNIPQLLIEEIEQMDTLHADR